MVPIYYDRLSSENYFGHVHNFTFQIVKVIPHGHPDPDPQHAFNFLLPSTDLQTKVFSSTSLMATGVARAHMRHHDSALLKIWLCHTVSEHFGMSSGFDNVEQSKQDS